MNPWDWTLIVLGGWMHAVAEWFEDMADKLRQLWGAR